MPLLLVRITKYPSNTTFVFLLGADLLCVDEPCAETLELSVTMISTLFIATHVSILTSDISSKTDILPSVTYRTFCYQDTY